jgi:hypothetical protein
MCMHTNKEGRNANTWFANPFHSNCFLSRRIYLRPLHSRSKGGVAVIFGSHQRKKPHSLSPSECAVTHKHIQAHMYATAEKNLNGKQQLKVRLGKNLMTHCFSETEIFTSSIHPPRSEQLCSPCIIIHTKCCRALFASPSSVMARPCNYFETFVCASLNTFFLMGSQRIASSAHICIYKTSLAICNWYSTMVIARAVESNFSLWRHWTFQKNTTLIHFCARFVYIF